MRQHSTKMIRKLIFLLVAVLVLAEARKNSKNKFKIVGGHAAQIEWAPYQISLQYYGYHMCGGSIIDKYHILTAAHCVYGVSHAFLTIRAGSMRSSSGGNVYKIRNIHIHPQYNNVTSDLDVAVLDLENPILQSSKAMPIPLSSTLPDGYEYLYVTGWGHVQEKGQASEILQAVYVPVVPFNVCKKRLPKLTDYMFCAGFPEGGKDSCQGDSGGPAVIGGKLVGVVSWGIGCARPGTPGVYAAVPNLLTFIQEYASPVIS